MLREVENPQLQGVRRGRLRSANPAGLRYAILVKTRQNFDAIQDGAAVVSIHGPGADDAAVENSGWGCLNAGVTAHHLKHLHSCQH